MTPASAAPPVSAARRLRPETRDIHQTSAEHLEDIFPILHVSPLDLGQGLRNQVEMMKRQRSFASDERTSLLPAVADRNEVNRRREFDVDVQRLLQGGNRPKQGVIVRHELHVDVNRRRSQSTNTAVAPPVKYTRAGDRAARPRARMNSRMRPASASGRMPAPAQS